MSFAQGLIAGLVVLFGIALSVAALFFCIDVVISWISPGYEEPQRTLLAVLAIKWRELTALLHRIY